MLYLRRVDNLLGRVPLIPCFLDGNATSTVPHMYSSRQRDVFECCCACGAGPTTRRGSHIYEINTWLWNFGRPQPSVGCLSVAKTERILRKSQSEASKRGWATKLACKWPSYGICLVYTWYIPGIFLVYRTVNHAFWVLSSSCPENPCCIHVFPIHPVLIAPLKPCKTIGSLKLVYVMYIPCIYMVYVMYMPGMFGTQFWRWIMLSYTFLASTLYCPQQCHWYAASNYA